MKWWPLVWRSTCDYLEDLCEALKERKTKLSEEYADLLRECLCHRNALDAKDQEIAYLKSQRDRLVSSLKGMIHHTVTIINQTNHLSDFLNFHKQHNKEFLDKVDALIKEVEDSQ